MRRVASLVVAVAVLSAGGTAYAATSPIAGGKYEGSLSHGSRCSGCRGDVSLIVADDRLSLLAPSGINFTARCRPSTSEVKTLGAVTDAPEGTPISPSGQFHWGGQARSSTTVVGRFADHGQIVRGTLTFNAVGSTRCSFVAVPFRARLTGRPYAPRPGATIRCPTPRDSGAENIAVQPVHRDVGCTSALTLAHRWATTRACRQSPTDLRSCTLGEYVCEPVAEGQLDTLAAITCTSARNPTGIVEIIARWSCKSGIEDVYTAAISTTCAVARAVTKAWEKQVACAEPDVAGATCEAAGWRCTATVADFGPAGTVVSLCRAPEVQRKVVEITEVLPP